MSIIGRNDPCPCGSGKKYKKCCGKKDNVISINEVQIKKEQELLLEAFFTYFYDNWQEPLIDEYLEVKDTAPKHLDEALEDDDYFILSEAFAFHKKVKDGMTPFEIFIKKNTDNFRWATINHVSQYFKSYYSFYRVVEVSSDVIFLEDFFLKKKHQILKEDHPDEFEEGDYLLCELSNNEGIQKILFNYLVFKDFPRLYLEKIFILFTDSGLSWEKFLQENGYSIVKIVLILDNLQNKAVEEEEYINKYIFAMTWLNTPQSFLENNLPVEAIKSSQGKSKIINYLTTLDDPSLLSYENDLLVLSKEIIEEQLGINPKIKDIDHFPWENPLYREIALQIIEKSFFFFTPLQLAQGVKMWFDYTRLKQPRISKIETWIAAINYALLQIEFTPKITQEQVAGEFSVSTASLGKNFRDLKKTLKLEDYRTSKIPLPFRFNDLLKISGKKNLAEFFIDQAWEAENREERINLAKRAIEMDPYSVDAYVILGNEAEFWDEALEFYQLGVQAGEKSLGEDYFRKNKGHFWGFLETRPYMRAKFGLAKALWELGKKTEAVRHMLDMLELNPNDNQGIRYFLSNYLLLIGDDDNLEWLFRQYGDEVGAFLRYNYALFLFKKYGDVPESQEALKKAILSNKHVPHFLLSSKKIMESQPPYYSLGSKEEALMYVLEAKKVWKNIPGALKWLQRHLWFC